VTPREALESSVKEVTPPGRKRGYYLMTPHPGGTSAGMPKFEWIQCELDQSEILGWINQINCPILILQGNPVLLYRANFEFLIPEMEKRGKDISSLSYPGMIHGFYWGKIKSGATRESVEKVMEDMTAFIENYIN
tara:strand:+ start:334 stop:738 length:405 start_codon:yes stop_codon:yes gene_type:complete